MQKPLLIRVKSDDIPGLATEVEAIEALFGNLKRVSPERPEPTRVLGQEEVAFEVFIRPFGTARFAASWWGAACSIGRDSERHRLRCEFVVWVNDGYCYRSTHLRPHGRRAAGYVTLQTAYQSDTRSGYDSPPQDRCRKGRFCAENAHHRAGFRHRQARNGLPPPHSCTEHRPGQMDPGMPGIESKADGRISPAVRENQRSVHFSEKNVSFMQMAFGWPLIGYLDE